MIQRIREWWTWLHRDVTDVDIATDGERAFILASSRRRFKRAVELEFDREELVVLHDMLEGVLDRCHCGAIAEYEDSAGQWWCSECKFAVNQNCPCSDRSASEVPHEGR